MSSLPKSKKRSIYKRWWFWAIVIVALLVLFAAGAIMQQVSNARDNAYAYLQQDVVVKERDLRKEISTTGIIVPERVQQIVSPVAGSVEEVSVSVGDAVIKDDVLMRIAGVDITAPFDGRVLFVDTFEGATALPSAPIAAIGYTTNHIEFYASESEAIDLSDGQEVEFTIPAYTDGRDTFTGEIDTVSLTKTASAAALAGEGDSGYLVTVAIDDLPNDVESLVGVTADLTVTVAEKQDATSLDAGAIQYDEDGDPFVYVLPELTDEFLETASETEDIETLLETKKITTGFRGDEFIEVTDGMRVGDKALLFIPGAAAESNSPFGF